MRSVRRHCGSFSSFFLNLPQMTFPSIAILGPGLLGGSLALAVRERVSGAQIRVWARRQDRLEAVRCLGIADEVSTDAAEIAAGASLIIFCMPIGAMEAVGLQIADAVGPGTIVTDVGSVKQPVVRTLGKIFGPRFIGSHPMAGSEQAGIEAARADLFQGAVTILTPEEGTRAESVRALAAFWEALGCRVAMMTPHAHDEAVALISHLPHLAAAALIQAALRENPAALDLHGNGFFDTTRVASGPPDMWAEILVQNRDAVKKAVHAMIENLSEVSKLLDTQETGEIEEYLAEARRTRNRLRQPAQKTIS
jgi:prephenate dehydrogenase